MYNDYYLEQINNKLTTTNSKLEEIIENQEVIIEKQEEQISGDKEIIETLNVEISHIVCANLILVLALIYTFITRCLR